MTQLSSDRRGFLLAQSTPDATTCVVIGGLVHARGIEFNHYQAVLWFVDTASRHPAPAGVTPNRLEVITIESSAADQTVAVVEQFLRLNPRRLPDVFITEMILSHQPAAYQQIVGQVHAELEDTRRARFTRQQDGFTWQRNVLRNAPAYLRQRLPAGWAGILRGIPAFVCGAGPSLDISIKPLAAHASTAVVFSADSALQALARHGVQADFAVSIDAAKVPAKCLPDQSLPTRVVLSTVSPPAWQEALPVENTFFLSSNQITDDWFATLGARRTDITASESCGSTAIDLAHHLGCNPIYLFGIDLAVDPATPGRRHQQNANPDLYKESNYDPTAKLPRVPGNYTEKVPCFALGDWRALDARLSTRTDTRFFNVTDRGARLRGTTVLHPDQFALEATTEAKAAGLARLGHEPATSVAPIETALGRLRTAGERCHGALPALRSALAQGGPEALSTAFRSVVIDPECGRVLGAFALKLMPHLVPPIEGDAAFWRTLLDEYAELSDLARTAACDAT